MNIVVRIPSGNYLVLNHGRYIKTSKLWRVPILDSMSKAQMFSSNDTKVRYVTITDSFYKKLANWG